MELTDHLLLVLAVIPLEPVHPPRSSGFASTILGAFLAVGLLIVVAKFTSSKPKNRRRPRR